MKKLIELRKESGYTQNDLANRLGISRSTLSLYESSKREPDIDTLKKVATFFDVSLDYLTGMGGEQAEDTLHSFVGQKECSTLYKRIADLRKELRITQDEFARRLCTTQRNISHYETGDRIPPIEVLIEMCDLFDVSMDYLVGRTKEKQQEAGRGRYEKLEEEAPVCMCMEKSEVREYERILFSETLPSIAKAVSVLQIDLFAVPENIANDVLELYIAEMKKIVNCYMDEQLIIFTKLRGFSPQTTGDRKE